MTAASAGAQGFPRTQTACNGQIITDIVVRPQPPSFGGIFARSAFLSQMVRVLHVTTHEDVIRRFILLEKGKPCLALRRTETERILRAQPYLAEASVTAYPDPSGYGVRIEVVTVDEASAIVSAGIEGSSPFLTSARLGNGNVRGQGVFALAEWRDGAVYRDAFVARATHYQFMGKPMQLSLMGARRILGGAWATELSYPFFSDIQRAAWRGLSGSERTYVGFERTRGSMDAAVGVKRSFFDLGGIFRIGEPGRLSLFGASISREEHAAEATPVIISKRGLIRDTSTQLISRYGKRRSARFNTLWGVRNVSFARVRGFDALTAEQDIRRGFQIGSLFGRSVSAFGSSDDDIFVSVDAYAGIGSDRFFAAVQLTGEGRQNYDTNRWDGLLGSGRLAAYFKSDERHTAILSAEWSGGWRQLAPFQLTLGERWGGMLAYAGAALPGGERGIARFENRWVLGNVRGSGDLGAAVFTEAGRMWAGDVPFGVTSPIRYAVGASVLAAIPPRSQRLWRLDFALPLDRADGGRFEVRLTSSRPTQSFWREPDDVRRSRSKTVPTSIFTWP
jgi:hypothetical protein